MASPIDPPRSAVAPVTRLLAEAALQRQSALLEADKPAAAPAPRVDPGASPPAITPAPLPANQAPPLPVDKATISAQAREQLGAGTGIPSAAGAAGRGAGGGASTALPMSAPNAAAAPAMAGVSAAALSWPADGIGTPLMRMVSAIVQQLTASSAMPVRVVAAQAWPVAMQDVLNGADPQQTLPPLQNWLVGQGSIQTADGERGFSLALQVPVAWAKSMSQASASPAAAAPAPLGASLAGPARALASGLFAVVLQPLDQTAARTSALLALAVTPGPGASAPQLYDRDLLQMRNDPWLHMALQQAHQQWCEDEEATVRRGAAEPCHTVGCPYAGRAPCEQPFCMALRTQPLQPVPAA